MSQGAYFVGIVEGAAVADATADTGVSDAEGAADSL